MQAPCGCVVLLCERLHQGPSTAYTGWFPGLAQSAMVVAAAAGGAGVAGAPVAVWFCSLRDCTQALSTAESPLLRLALLFSDSGHAACNSSHPRLSSMYMALSRPLQSGTLLLLFLARAVLGLGG